MNARTLGLGLSCPLLFLAAGAARGQEPPMPPVQEVEVCHPIVRLVRDYEEFVGRTEAGAVVEVRPLVSGALEEVSFRDGAKVHKGDLLFVIDPRPFQADLDKEDAEVKRSEARLAHVAKNLATRKSMVDRHVIGQQDFDEAVADHDDAEAAALIARAARDRARLNLESTRIKAPIDGQIGRALLSPGNLVEAGVTPLATIVSIDRVFAAFDIDERTLLRLRKAFREGRMKAKGESDLPVLMGLADQDGFPYRGKIDFVDNQVDPAKGTLRMRAVFPNADQALLPGMFARVRLVTSEPHEAILIPSHDSVAGQDGPHVAIINDQNVIEARAVRWGRQYEGLWSVLEGLKTGDRVIIEGNMWRAGPKVKPKLVDPPIPPEFTRNQPQADDHSSTDGKPSGEK